MRSILTLGVIGLIIVFSNCKESAKPVVHNNCGGLVTDTMGTGDNGRIYMPNAFTPNADGLNDISRPLTFNIASINFIIYDDANNQVFATTQLGQGWNTSVAANSSTVYYYRIQAVTNSNHHIGVCGELYKLSCRPANVSLHFEDQLTANGFTGVTSEQLSNCQ